MPEWRLDCSQALAVSVPALFTVDLFLHLRRGGAFLISLASFEEADLPSGFLLTVSEALPAQVARITVSFCALITGGSAPADDGLFSFKVKLFSSRTRATQVLCIMNKVFVAKLRVGWLVLFLSLFGLPFFTLLLIPASVFLLIRETWITLAELVIGN